MAHAWRDPSLTGKYEDITKDGPAPKTQRTREENSQTVRIDGAKRRLILAKVIEAPQSLFLGLHPRVFLSVFLMYCLGSGLFVR